MSEIRRSDSDYVPTTGFDGVAANRASLREHDVQRRSMLMMLPDVVLGLLVVAEFALLGVIAAGEYAQMYSAAEAITPEMAPWQLRLLAGGLMLAYLAVWHHVGTRAHLVRAIVTGADGNGGSPHLRGFGISGVVALLVGLVVLGVVALSRAEILAQREGDRVAGQIRRDALAPIDPDIVVAARAEAYESVFWPDLRWTVVALALLASASVLLGMTSGPLKQAATIAIGRRSVRRGRRGLVRLRAAETAAHLELASRIENRARVVELADRHDRELPHRYDAAKEQFRLALAARLGDPARTSVVLPEPADRE